MNSKRNDSHGDFYADYCQDSDLWGPVTARQQLPNGYETMIRPVDDHHHFDSCSRCGEPIEHGEAVYFQCCDEWFVQGMAGELPYCSLNCARVSREEG